MAAKNVKPTPCPVELFRTHGIKRHRFWSFLNQICVNCDLHPEVLTNVGVPLTEFCVNYIHWDVDPVHSICGSSSWHLYQRASQKAGLISTAIWNCCASTICSTLKKIFRLHCNGIQSMAGHGAHVCRWIGPKNCIFSSVGCIWQQITVVLPERSVAAMA